MERIIRRNSRFQILTPNGWSNFTGISQSKALKTISITTDKNDIKCTFDHAIQVYNGEYVEAANLTEGEILRSRVGDVKITGMTLNKEETTVYDPIDVELGNVYFSNDIQSHNCEFMGSSGTLIAGWKLRELTDLTPIHDKMGIKQYAAPEEGHAYVMIVDVSRGKGLDYSAFSIIDVTEMPYQQVCTFRSNLTTPLDYANIIHNMAKVYHNAYVLVEINDIGEQVSTAVLFDFEYENIIYTVNNGRGGKTVSSGFGTQTSQDRGIRTTKSVKSVGCSILKLLIEQNQLIINDFDSIFELSRFSRKNASYEAESGSTDDLVMGLVLFGWLSDQPYFKELSDINTLMKLRDRSDEEIMSEMTPFGFTSEFENLTMDERSSRMAIEGEWQTYEMMRDLHNF